MKAFWLHAWAGASIPCAGVFIGGVQRFVFGEVEPIFPATQISAVILVLALFMLSSIMQVRMPIADRRTAAFVGAAWLGILLAFQGAVGSFFPSTGWDLLPVGTGPLRWMSMLWILLVPLLVHLMLTRKKALPDRSSKN